MDLPPLWRKFPFSSPPDYCIIKYGTERACPPCFVLTAHRGQGAPGSRPCGRRAQWSRPTSIASAGRTGGHMGPPLRKIRSVIRHCEEGRRPDAAIRTFMQGERIPTAPPGPRNDGVGAQGAPQAAKGRPHEEQRTCCGRRPLIRPFGPPPPKEKVQTARPGGRALQGCAIRCPPHHGRGKPLPYGKTRRANTPGGASRMPRPIGSSHPTSHRTVIRHCEEGRRPDVAIRFPAIGHKRNGLPRPLRGLGMTGRGIACAATGAPVLGQQKRQKVSPLPLIEIGGEVMLYGGEAAPDGPAGAGGPGL